jgi:predicted kinase
MNELNPRVDNVRPSLIMLVGIPGSGKTTFAKNMAQKLNALHVTSDGIRQELRPNDNWYHPEDNGKVYEIMFKRTLDALAMGQTVLYDATNMSRKDRASILRQCPKYVKIECHIIWTPIEVCIERDAAREHPVGEDVIYKMLKRFEAPFYDEGFDSIEVFRSEYNQSEYYYKHMNAREIPHDNPHHTLDIAEHCRLCGNILLSQELPTVVKFAGYVHDIGKPLTKTFVNTKGETTEVAHYYGHQGMGAWLSYGFLNCESVTLAWLISTHMAPFVNQKYYNSLAPLYKNWIDALHKADLEAH